MTNRSRASANLKIFWNSAGVATAAVGLAGKLITSPRGRRSARSAASKSDCMKSTSGPTFTGMVSPPAMSAP